MAFSIIFCCSKFFFFFNNFLSTNIKYFLSDMSERALACRQRAATVDQRSLLVRGRPICWESQQTLNFCTARITFESYAELWHHASSGWFREEKSYAVCFFFPPCKTSTGI